MRRLGRGLGGGGGRRQGRRVRHRRNKDGQEVQGQMLRGLVNFDSNPSPNLPTEVPSLTDLEAASAHLDVIDKGGVGQAKKIVLPQSPSSSVFVQLPLLFVILQQRSLKVFSFHLPSVRLSLLM